MTTKIGGPSGGGGGDDGGGSSRAEMGRFGPSPAHFSTKTFQIVNDPNTNSIISWGKFGDSFIIWDPIKFSVEILPNYFRHNNFSSFVSQLNNYGFRKIGVDHQWEYANKDFQKGQQHLLSNIRRRSLQKGSSIFSLKEKLSNANDGMKKEIDKMKMKQADMDSHIISLQQQTYNFDAISKKLIVQCAKAVQIIAKRERESRHRDDDDDNEGRVAKREKVAVVDSVEISSEGDEKNGEEDHEKGIVKENIDDHAAKSIAAKIDGNYSNDLIWMKNHFEEDYDEVCEVEGETTSNIHAKIAKDFQELLTNPDHFYLEMNFGFTELLTKADAGISLK